MLAQVGKPWLAVVVANNLPRAGKRAGAPPLKLVDFVGSETRLAWAKSNGCYWTERTCDVVAASGQLEVLRWARQRGCPWINSLMCGTAARGGHLELEVLRWVRGQGCPWDEMTCAEAARGGHLEVLRWAR